MFADGFGGRARSLGFRAVQRLECSSDGLRAALRKAAKVPLDDWRGLWNRRLRPYLLGERARGLYQEIAARKGSLCLGMAATVGIGYVSGANDFFHLRPSEARSWRIPERFTRPTVRNSRLLPAGELTGDTLDAWRRADERMLLLCLPKGASPPAAVAGYLDSAAGRKARQAYKCRQREPWYCVPQVAAPDFFLAYMAGRAPALVRNAASATCCNALLAVRLRDRRLATRLMPAWRSPYAQLSCELEGHALGGGLLKLEPREAARVVLPAARALTEPARSEIEDATATLRAWRHCNGAAATEPSEPPTLRAAALAPLGC